MKFDFSYEKPVSTFLAKEATFINETVAVADGKIININDYSETPIKYTVIFNDDIINVNILIIDEEGHNAEGPQFSFSDKIE